MYIRGILSGGLPGRSSFQVQRQETSAAIGKKANSRQLEAPRTSSPSEMKKQAFSEVMAMTSDEPSHYVLTTHGPCGGEKVSSRSQRET